MNDATSRSLPEVPLDIFYRVFSYLDPIHQSDDSQAYESRRSLAFAGRTCRDFTGPALDILWKRLPDDQPLADLLCQLGIAKRKGFRKVYGYLGKKPGRYLLPYQDEEEYFLPGVAEVYEKRWKLSRGYNLKYVLRTTGDPRTHPNWPRFMEYASRVRAITLFVFDGPAWSSMWEELLALTNRAPILPRLQSVAYYHFIPQTLNQGAFALISPSVRSLNLSLNNAVWYELAEKLRSIFVQSFSAAPGIEKLRIDLPPYSLGGPLLKTHCSQLRHLEVLPQLDLSDLRVLQELPALQHMSISLEREDIFEASPAVTLTFKSITTLIVEGTWTNLTTLLDTARLPSMHALSITGWDYGEPAAELALAATQCFRTLATQHPSITSLSVSAAEGRVPPRRGCVAYATSLVPNAFVSSLLDLAHPLLALSALRHLALGFPTYFDIACTDVDLRAVAEAFPALEAFHLRIWPYFGFSLRGGDPPERVRGGPLDALAHFARSCPGLRVLHLPAMEMTLTLKLTEGTPGPGPESPSGEAHGLRTLVIPRVLLPVGSSRADLAGRMAEVVRGVFPLAASPFRLGKLVMEGDWAVVDGVTCLGCTRGSDLDTFAFSPYARRPE